MKRKLFSCAIVLITALGAHNAELNYNSWGFDTDGMNSAVKPGDNFFEYVNGTWARNTQIPPDKTSWGPFYMLHELSENRVREIIENWLIKDLDPATDEAKIALLYKTFLDIEAVEMLDAEPIREYLEFIKTISSHDEMAAFMGRAFFSLGSSFFGSYISEDAKAPDQYIIYLSQAGLGLSGRDFYLDDKFIDIKMAYQKYVSSMLELIGWDEPQKNAADIIALETRIADAHWTPAQSRNIDLTYNLTKITDLIDQASQFNWRTFFNSAHLGDIEWFVVKQNTAIFELAKIFGETPVSTLKTWQAFRIADEVSPLLSKRFVDLNWEFRAKFLNGAQEQRPRFKRAIAFVENIMGEAIGRTYVAQYFPPEAKEKMQSLVEDLREAFRARIENLHWMSAETKINALKKLSSFMVKIGYPSKWRDYSSLDIKENDLLGNNLRSARFDWDEMVSRIGKKVDREEWGMTPQTVNAYYSSVLNEIVFPAAILQPPFFNMSADAAINYGGIGGVIGHEMTHGFDDQGRKSDWSGMLSDWWTSEDAQQFEEQASRLGTQYEAIDLPQLPDFHINPRLTMGENIADLGGILLGLDAYKLSLKDQSAPVLDGFSGEQRVFLGWAQVWRGIIRTEALQQRLVNDPHSPADVRAFAPLRNVDAWYEAFGVSEQDANYISPEERVRIW